MITGFSSLSQFNPAIISTLKFGHAIPFILQSKWPSLMTMFEDLAVTATFKSSAKIKWLVLVGKVGKLWLYLKLEEKFDFLAPVSKSNLWLHLQKRTGWYNKLSLLDLELEEEDLVTWISLLE